VSRLTKSRKSLGEKQARRLRALGRLRKTESENPAVVRAMVGWESVISVYLYSGKVHDIS